MTSEQQQEQASLYALGLLDADEADAFERLLAAQPELHQLVRELQETAAALALTTDGAPDFGPSGALRQRVLDLIARETALEGNTYHEPAGTGGIIRPRFVWVPWAVAALLLGCCVLLYLERGSLTQRLQEADRLAANPVHLLSSEGMLSRVAFCELEPTPEAPAYPHAAILWDESTHKGILRATRFTPPANGKDYQLWAVEVARKEPVNAGVVHVDAQGHADMAFQPDAIPGDNKVVAVAISLEEAGGSQSNKGPILFLGKL